ncbi:hypothetical protein ACQEU3_45500 [Spirillospora sp. CA-253888]
MDMPLDRRHERKSDVKIFQGFHPLRDVVETGGMEIDLEVKLEKTVETHDWHLLFALYDVPLDSSLSTWVEKCRNHPDVTLLDRVFPFLAERQFSASCRVTVHIPAGERLKLRLGARVLRLQLGDERKDATLFNAANIVAYTADGTQYHEITARCSER